MNEPKSPRNSEDLQVMSYLVGGTIQGHLDTVATSNDFYRDERYNGNAEDYKRFSFKSKDNLKEPPVHVIH